MGEKELLAQLSKETPLFDAIIDGAGGAIALLGTNLLKVRFPFLPA